MEDSESVAASRLLPPSPNLETRQLQLLAAVTLLQGLPSTFLGRSSRGGDVERRWGGQFSFLLQLKSLPVHLGKKGKSKLATSPLLASADPLTSADFCEGEMLWGQITIFPMSPKYTITYLKKQSCLSVFHILAAVTSHLPLVFNRSAWKKRVNRAS